MRTCTKSGRMGNLLLSLILLAAFESFSQINGPTSPNASCDSNYTYDDFNVYVTPNWTIANGTVISSSTSGTLYSATVQWSASGSGTINFRSKSNIISSLSVTVSGAVGAPSASNASSCSHSTLTATPGSNSNTIRWYDSSSGGTLLATGTTSPLTYNTTTYYITSYNTSTGCESGGSRLAVTLTINPVPLSPAASNTSVWCSGTMSATPGTNGNTVRWYDASTGGNLLATSTTSPTTAITTTYYVSSYNSTTGCESTTGSRVAVTLSVNVPGAPTPYNTTVCGSGTMIASPATPTDNVRWYSAPTGGSLLATGTISPITTTTTTYYIVSYYSPYSCESPTRVAATVTVNPIPGAPTASSATLCSSGGTLTATPGTNANSIRWYNAATGGSLLGTGTTSPVAYQSTTTFYVSSYNTTTSCESTSARIAVTLTLNPIPGDPTASNTTICGSSGTMTATPGTNANSVRWYSASTGGSPLATSTTSPSTSTTTTYYLSSYNTSTLCESTSARIAVTFTLNPIPGAPTASNTSICGSSGTMTATPGTSANTVRWYSTSTGGSPLATSTISPTTSATTTYYLSSYNTSTLCESTSARIAVTFTLNPIPGAPTASNTTICGPSGTMTATPGTNANSVRWYSASTGGSPLATSTTSPSTSTTTTYYLSSYNTTTLCESTSARIAVTLTVIIPGAPTPFNTFVCGSGTMSATPATPADNVRWYSAITGGTLLATSTTSPITTTTTTYYIVSYNSTYSCESWPRVAATVTVNPVPQITVAGSTKLVYGSPIVLSTIPSASYRWINNGSTMMTTPTDTVSIAGSYTVAVKATVNTPNECFSSPVSIGISNQPVRINFVSRIGIMKSGITPTSSLYTLNQKDLAQTIAFQDGLGRTLQTIGIGLSGQQKDIVSPVGYGWQGLMDTTYLPYVRSTKSGLFRRFAVHDSTTYQYSPSEQKQFYQNTPYVATDGQPFARTIHRAALDGRVTEQGAPGADWQPGQHTVKNTITLNTSTYPVKFWKSNAKSSENYPPGTVSVSLTTDENNNLVRTYTNKQGQTVLKQVQLDETINGVTTLWLETYYVYDSLGRLSYQLPPKAMNVLGGGSSLDASNSTVADLVYKYTYDSLGRVVEKKTPGAAVQYIVYDKLGRVVLTQDAYLRTTSQWQFIKYDFLNRPVYSGLYQNTTQTTRKGVQNLFIAIDYTAQPRYETEQANATYQGYSNTVFPTSGLTVLTANYYDHYDFDRNSIADYTYDNSHLAGLPNAASAATRNLPTGSKKLILASANWLTSVVFYDNFDRPVQAQSNNHLNLNVQDKASVLYDFAGHTMKTRATHVGASTVNIVQRYTYDPNWRTLGIFHTIDNNAEQQLALYSYNALGQVIDKKLHVNGGAFLQSVDLRYSIRGWLKSINNAQLANDSGVTNDDTNDYFGMEMVYNTADAGLGNTQYYNGNISATKWKTIGEATATAGQRSYKYSYDKSDKLKGATFQAYGSTAWDKEANTLNETMGYDHNGNILSLTRNQNQRSLSGITVASTPQTIDNLTYTHATGNQLSKVEDAASPTLGFINGANTATEYTYSSDGSLTADQNKGISTITYNVLGKPQQVTFTDGRVIAYTYDAAGTKLKMAVTVGGITTTTDYAGSFVYSNNALSFFSSPEGRVVKNGTNYEYQYAIADHQGNTRIVFSSATPARLPLQLPLKEMRTTIRISLQM